MLKEYTVEDFDRALEQGDTKTLYTICSDVDWYSWRPDMTVNKSFSISTMQDGWYDASTSEDYRRVRDRIVNLHGGKVHVRVG